MMLIKTDGITYQRHLESQNPKLLPTKKPPAKKQKAQYLNTFYYLLITQY